MEAARATPGANIAIEGMISEGKAHAYEQGLKQSWAGHPIAQGVIGTAAALPWYGSGVGAAIYGGTTGFAGGVREHATPGQIAGRTVIGAGTAVAARALMGRMIPKGTPLIPAIARGSLAIGGMSALGGGIGAAVQPGATAGSVAEGAAKGYLRGAPIGAALPLARHIVGKGSTGLGKWLQGRMDKKVAEAILRVRSGEPGAAKTLLKSLTRYEKRYGPYKVSMGRGPAPGEPAIVGSARQMAEQQMVEAAAAMDANCPEAKRRSWMR